MKMIKRLPVWKVYERDTICQWKVYDKIIISAKRNLYKGKGSDIKKGPPRIKVFLVPTHPGTV